MKNQQKFHLKFLFTTLNPEYYIVILMLYVDSGCCPTFWVFSFLILTKYIDELQNIYIYTKAFVVETKSEGVSSSEKLEIEFMKTKIQVCMVIFWILCMNFNFKVDVRLFESLNLKKKYEKPFPSIANLQNLSGVQMRRRFFFYHDFDEVQGLVNIGGSRSAPVLGAQQ